jgi:hypothetical protein
LEFGIAIAFEDVDFPVLIISKFGRIQHAKDDTNTKWKMEIVPVKYVIVLIGSILYFHVNTSLQAELES